MDPALRLLEVYRLRDGRWELAQVAADDEVVRAEPFGAIENPLARLWLTPQPGPTDEAE